MTAILDLEDGSTITLTGDARRDIWKQAAGLPWTSACFIDGIEGTGTVPETVTNPLRPPITEELLLRYRDSLRIKTGVADLQLPDVHGLKRSPVGTTIIQARNGRIITRWRRLDHLSDLGIDHLGPFQRSWMPGILIEINTWR